MAVRDGLFGKSEASRLRIRHRTKQDIIICSRYEAQTIRVQSSRNTGSH